MNTTRTKHDNLLAKIAEAIQAGQYVISNHAYQRAKDRFVPAPHIEHVLLQGFHEQKKDKFDEQFGSWNYAIRGTTPDQIKVRVVVTFTDTGLLVITVINLGQ